MVSTASRDLTRVLLIEEMRVLAAVIAAARVVQVVEMVVDSSLMLWWEACFAPPAVPHCPPLSGCARDGVLDVTPIDATSAALVTTIQRQGRVSSLLCLPPSSPAPGVSLACSEGTLF